MRLNFMKPRTEKTKLSFGDKLNNYANQLYNNKQLSPDKFAKITSSLGDPDVKRLLGLSVKVLGMEKVMQITQSSILGGAVASGGSLFPALVAAEVAKSVAVAGTIALEKKYTGNKGFMYALSAIPGVCGFAPIIELYKKHPELFKFVAGYMFNRQQDYEKKSSAKIRLPTQARHNTSSKVKKIILPSRSCPPSSTHNKPATIIKLPTKTTHNSTNYSQFKLAANY